MFNVIPHSIYSDGSSLENLRVRPCGESIGPTIKPPLGPTRCCILFRFCVYGYLTGVVSSLTLQQWICWYDFISFYQKTKLHSELDGMSANVSSDSAASSALAVSTSGYEALKPSRCMLRIRSVYESRRSA